MIYERIPMMIFILASGYLLTVYLLLALAKRTGNKTHNENLPLASQEEQNKRAVTPKVTEVTSVVR
ncbi:hypothetical protein G7B40_028360 [Aetokthonos hydrillicola Thurmond2011]|jgi:hypothetical protein|uniref:Uncharacterized protein n=1 Tax=Aetokthonos hydrillicola Thurmond2011 TaxID=2712845 RepID=A0AAP5MCK4_9CYAN|nr:hypothetical protein [Aetokthonos hydrillicola]MBO3458128.1 hypothetical protein [Aetokthonos hydrillicola CCALA 1050]MBW4584349.1 hypothetical protein [Aetokthonos hydrillicola CCALA 1050]MDR9898443.1 hypothetical protein [Aetokthonos hydrillicola Thurmond2011]